MATTYTLAAGEGAYQKVLTAASVDTVSFPDEPGSGPRTIEVINEGTAGIRWRYDGTAPTVSDAAVIYSPPNSVRTVATGTSSATDVKLISTGTPTYSVSRAR